MIPRAGGKGKYAPPRPRAAPPRPDYERAAVAWARYKIFMRRMVLLALLTAGLSVAYLAKGGDGLHLHMVIATVGRGRLDGAGRGPG